jgi:hypothetical protein
VIANIEQARSDTVAAGLFVELRREPVGPLLYLLGDVSRRSGRPRRAPRACGLRMIGMGAAAVVEVRIAETIAADAAWHCSMLLKPQLVMCPVTSLRQNSPALASGAVIAASAIAATNTAAGAATVFKRSLIVLPAFFLGVGSFRGVA